MRVGLQGEQCSGGVVDPGLMLPRFSTPDIASSGRGGKVMNECMEEEAIYADQQGRRKQAHAE